MSSRSATVLVIFVIAIVAFCLASVCGAMTGTFTLFPNATDEVNEIGNTSYTEYKSYNSEYHDSGGYDDSHVEETVQEDKSKEDSSGNILEKITGQSDDKSTNVETTTDSGSSSDSANVETTTDSGSSSDSANVETTTDSGGSNENKP